MSMIILQKYQKENNSEIYSPISFTPTPKISPYNKIRRALSENQNAQA